MTLSRHLPAESSMKKRLEEAMHELGRPPASTA